MSDKQSTDRVYDSDHYSDELRVPFIFVPHGAPMPTEWMAEHPGWVKFPATFVPRPNRAAHTVQAVSRPSATPVGTAPSQGRPSTADHVAPVASVSTAFGMARVT